MRKLSEYKIGLENFYNKKKKYLLLTCMREKYICLLLAHIILQFGPNGQSFIIHYSARPRNCILMFVKLKKNNVKTTQQLSTLVSDFLARCEVWQVALSDVFVETLRSQSAQARSLRNESHHHLPSTDIIQLV